MKFILPLPPSINNTYAVSREGQRTLYKKAIARDWEIEAGWEIIRQRSKFDPKYPLKGDIQVDIHWLCTRKRDIDAGIKILLDLLQRQNIYGNDSQVKALHVAIEASVKDQAIIEVGEIE